MPSQIDLALGAGTATLLLLLAALLFRDYRAVVAGRRATAFALGSAAHALYSSSLTPNGWVGIGAGFWTNHGDSRGSRFRVALGMPRDAFYASGTFGQYVIIVPSERLVIARFGISANQYDIAGVSRLVADVIAATGGKGRVAGRD